MADSPAVIECPSPLRFSSCRERVLQFVLDRVVHDFSNAAGGITALAAHHLEQNGLELGLQTSLQLIRESAEQCRALLSVVRSLLDPNMDDDAYIRAEDLAEGLGQLLRLLLPRSVRFEPILPRPQAVVRVRPPEFQMRWLGVASLGCEGLYGPGHIAFGWVAEGGLCWFTYRSSNPRGPAIIEHAAQILLPLAGAVERLRCQTQGWDFTAQVALPLELEG